MASVYPLRAGALLRGSLDYRIVSQLGHGGFGITYLAEAHQTVDGIPHRLRFCIKEFFLSGRCSRDGSGRVTFGTDAATVRDGKSDFKAEAETLKGLNDVPGIVPVKEVIEANDTVYYVMQFVEGQTLDKKIREATRMEERDALPIILGVGRALAVLHDKKMTHLDVKPDNIMLTADAGRVQPVLIDFGLSRSYGMFGRESSGKKVSAISEGYSPVEQYGVITGFSPRSDVYALAATLFHMLTGHSPRPASDVTEDYLRAELGAHGATDRTTGAIVRAMRMDADDRTASVRLFMGELKDGAAGPAAGGGGRGSTPTKPIDPVPGPSPWLVRCAIGAVVALLALGALVGHFTGSLPSLPWPGEAAPAAASAQGRETFTVNGVSFTMVRVEGGTFTMGATSEQGSDAWDREKPAHKVTLSSYAIGETEVTQELWQAVMGSNPSRFRGPKRPVECVSWNDCQDFIKKLNAMTGRTFRLPTEAEWEFAARGGRHSRGYKYAGSNNLGDVAWYSSNSGSQTHDVATKRPNELGLYDMSGNVWEWCSDLYASDYYKNSPQNNPKGPTDGSDRVRRGGCWCSGAGYCRSSFRYYGAPAGRDCDLGLRLVLSE